MVAIWYLLVLAPFIAIPMLWWNHRRKAAARDSMVDVRWKQLLDTATVDAAAPVAVAPSSAAYARKNRTLDPAQTLLYYLLKNSLPDHEVLARVVLTDVLEPAVATGSEREQRLRGLAQHSVDFVVCNKALQPVAVIDLAADDAPVTAQDFKTRSLAQAGLRYLRLSRKTLPRRETVRALVLGG